MTEVGWLVWGFYVCLADLNFGRFLFVGVFVCAVLLGAFFDSCQI